VHGLPNLLLRGGLAWPLEAEQIILLPSAGASFLAAIGPAGGDVIPAVQAGMAVVLLNSGKRSGIRMAISWHQARWLDGLWLAEFGAVGVR
jgi:hypothetical protein